MAQARLVLPQRLYPQALSCCKAKVIGLKPLAGLLMICGSAERTATFAMHHHAGTYCRLASGGLIPLLNVLVFV